MTASCSINQFWLKDSTSCLTVIKPYYSNCHYFQEIGWFVSSGKQFLIVPILGNSRTL